jgi:DNA modification methylase
MSDLDSRPMSQPTKTQATKRWRAIQREADRASSQYALIFDDARQALARLPDDSVDTCVTSPPYWAARDYEHPDQIGLETEVDDYVESIVKTFDSLRRALRPDGTVWLNIGDSYYSGAGTVNGLPPEKGWVRNKQLTLIPFRVALALQEDGWWLRNVLVWHKPNAMPSSVKDRLTNTWEPVFLFSPSERYYFNLDAVRVPHETDDAIERRRATSGNGGGKAKNQPELRRWLNSPRHRATIDGLKEVERRPNAPDPTVLAAYLREALAENGKSIKWVAEQLDLPFERTRHYFRIDRIGSRLPPPETWEQLKTLLDLDDTFEEAMAVEVGDNVFRNHPKGRNPGDLWSIALAGGADGHFAMMPEKLADKLLTATLPPGGVAIDPFMGTGTTGRAAIRQGGKFVGIDLREDYAENFLADNPPTLPF